MLLWISLFLLTLVFVPQWLFLHWGNLIMLLSQFPLTFHHIHNSQQHALFHFIAYDYSLMTICWLGWSSWSFGEDIFKLIASAAAREFCDGIQIGTDMIPHWKYQVKPHSSPWFSAACPAAIVHRNHFFCLYQKDKSSDSKVKFRQASNRCKRVFEAAKLAYANKTKESISSQKLGSRDF